MADEESNFTSDSFLLSVSQIKRFKNFDDAGYKLVSPYFCTIRKFITNLILIALVRRTICISIYLPRNYFK